MALGLGFGASWSGGGGGGGGWWLWWWVIGNISPDIISGKVFVAFSAKIKIESFGCCSLAAS